MKEIKHIGTTSFILHDTRLANVVHLKSEIDIVQLLYLESFDESVNKNDIIEIENLAQIKHNIEYFIHMPIDLDLSNTKDWKKLIYFSDKLSVLDAEHIIIHPSNHNIFFKELEYFLENYPKTLIENIDTQEFIETIPHGKFNICFDVGHAILNGIDLKKFIKIYGYDIKAYHLHGVDRGRDHQSVRYLEKDLLKYLIDFAIANDVKIILEIFGKKDFYDSKEFLRGFFKENGYCYHRWD